MKRITGNRRLTAEEAAKREPALSIAARLARAADVSLDELAAGVASE